MYKIRKAGAVVLKDRKMLIVKPKGKEYYITPGGKYDAGESAEECLRRELKEELDTDLVSFSHYKTYEFEKAAHSDFPLSLEWYIVELKNPPTPSSEIEILDWLSREDFLTKKFNLAPSFEASVPDLIKDNLL